MSENVVHVRVRQRVENVSIELIFAHARKSSVYAWCVAYSWQLLADGSAMRRRILHNLTVHDPRQNRDSSHEWLKNDISEQLSRVVCAPLRAKTRTDE